jgi:hypothetical protein
MRVQFIALFALAGSLPSCEPRVSAAEQERGVAAFATVQQVFQHPRCQNCHIPGDAPLQFDDGVVHAMDVIRGPDGHGAPGLPCATCHGESNPPLSYGPHAPPGAPHWALPGPKHKMAWIGLPPAELCKIIKDKDENGGRNFDALIRHISEDSLVLWGWNPGGERAPVSVPHADFVVKFKEWAAARGPCPASEVARAAER